MSNNWGPVENHLLAHYAWIQATTSPDCLKFKTLNTKWEMEVINSPIFLAHPHIRMGGLCYLLLHLVLLVFFDTTNCDLSFVTSTNAQHRLLTNPVVLVFSTHPNTIAM